MELDLYWHLLIVSMMHGRMKWNTTSGKEKQLMSKIVKFNAENVKRLQAVEITPDGNMVVIGGKNRAGKSSVLDSIMYALAGKRGMCERPLRDGATKGTIQIDLDNGMTAKRVFTSKGGNQIKVTKDGAEYPSPQAILDDLCGALTFEPLAFIGMDQKKQLETLKKIVGLDFAELNVCREALYSDRTNINRDIKNLLGQVSQMPTHKDAPDEEVRVSDLVKELVDAQKKNDDNHEVRVSVSDIADCGTHIQQSLDDIHNQIKELKKQKTLIENELAETTDVWQKAKEKATSLVDIETAEIQARLENAEVINQQVRDNQAVANAKSRLGESQSESDKMTSKIEKIDDTKAKMLSEAKFPVKGLSFETDCVLFDGVPFDQASSAEQLRVSAAMAAAMNPDLRIMLIRDGSLLDEDNMKLLSDFADKNDYQIWLESVTTDEGKCSVIIEDGMVATPKTKGKMK